MRLQSIDMAMAAPETPPLPEELIAQTAFWIREFALELHAETPHKLHGQSHDGYGLEFHPEFIRYVDRPCRRANCFDLACTHGLNSPTNAPPRQRATRSFRRLRREAPREFDVLWMMCVHGVSISGVAAALNARAKRLDKPERYSEATVLVLAVSGIHKLHTFA
jgi:hypothetical protein